MMKHSSTSDRNREHFCVKLLDVILELWVRWNVPKDAEAAKLSDNTDEVGRDGFVLWNTRCKSYVTTE